MTNRFYNESFNAALGSQARSAAVDGQFVNLQAAFDAVAAELDALAGSGGDITNLGGFPASFTGNGLKYLRVNVAEDAVEFVASGKVAIKSIGGTSYTLQAADAGVLLLFTATTAVTVTVPNAVFDQGAVVYVNQRGTGQVTFVAGAGLTLNSTDNLLSTRTQHAQVALEFLSASEATLLGERNAPSLNYASLVGGNNFQGAQAVAFASLADGATITPNASASNHFAVTLAGNRTLANPTNLVDGVILNFWIKQDATGSRTLAYGSKFKWPGGTAPTLTTAAGSLDLVIAQYNAALDMLACSITKDVR